MIELIAFDGDDTLWHNERLYRKGRERFQALLEKYHVNLEDDSPVDEVETRNLPIYGYGVMSFILSLIESAIDLTQGHFAAEDVQALLDLGKQMLNADIEVFDSAAGTLECLSKEYPLLLVTKGEPNHQLTKLKRSGLSDYFRHVEVVPDKNPAIYAKILERLSLPADKFLMIGNSLRSDILPVLELGGWAVYVPHVLTWNHEQAEHPGDGHARLFELKDISELPELLEQISI